MSYHINLIEFFEENYSKYPSKIAVKDNGKEINFEDLHSKAQSLAAYLIKTLNVKNEVIAVYLPKSIDSVVADLAIMYSGNAYMNLDVSNPHTRIEAICTQVKPVAVITLEKFKFETEAPINFVTCFENVTLPDQSEYSIDVLSDLIDTDPSCVINTSGSTGTPKAVVLNHRSFIDFIAAVKHEGYINENEVIGSLSPSVFDIYSFELCMLMTWGSTICVIPEMFAAFPAKLLELLQKEQVTYLFWVPTIMVNIANMELLDKFKLDSLHMIWFAGEVFPTAKFNYWKKTLPQCRFVNFYGPIEITLDCLFHEVKSCIEDNSPIPIGKPFRNTSIIVLDEDDKRVTQVGVEGELCIRGSSLAMGYYRNPEKTSAAFVQNPLNTNYPEIIYRTGDIVSLDENGDYLFRGRKDTLIKRMGYRIELAEIEHVIVDKLGVVNNCCALYKADTKDIVLVYESLEELPARDLQRQIMSLLPKYMVPTKYFHSKQMPRNLNGKIDRNMLKTQFIG